MEHAEMGELEQEVYQLISQSFIRLDTSDHLLMRRFGLTLTQSWALVHLAEPEGRSLSELAHLLICDKSNVTSIVDKLEEDGLAERKRGKAGDRRYTRVVLTEQGHQLRRSVMSAREYMVRKRLQVLNPEELYKLRDSLKRLVTLLISQFDNDKETQIIDAAFEQSHAASLPNSF